MMGSATGSQAYVAIIKQDPATPTVIPSSPAMQKVNFVSDDLEAKISTKVSDHIRDDRMTSDITVNGLDVMGGYDFEFQFENSKNDELLAAFLWAESWSTPQLNIDLGGGSFALAGSVLDLSSAVVKPVVVDGQKLKITGTDNNGENDGVYTLTETVTNVYSVEPPPVSDESFGTGVIANGSMIRNGKFYQPFFIERGHTDVNEFFKFLGMSANVLTLEMPDKSDVTGSYKFVGLTPKVDQVPESGAVYTGATLNPVFSTVTNIPSVLIDGVKQEGCFIKKLTLVVNNNVTPKTGLGKFGACETNPHRLSVAGSITMYFEDSTMYDRLLNGLAFSIDWTMETSDGKGYSFSLPRVKLDTDKINVTGIDDDVMDDGNYVALADPVTNCMIQIDKYELP